MSFREKFPVISYYFGKKLQILSTYFYRKNPVKWTIKTYKKRFGINLNLVKPTLFYEKVNYWKHYSYTADQDNLTDKIKVKQIIDEAETGIHTAKCYFESDNIKDLKEWYKANCEKLKRFVLKTSHSCGDVFIYDNGVITRKGGRKIKSINQVFKMLKIGLKFNQYYVRFEENYKNLEHKVFVEEYIDYDDDTIEYELMCNYGEVKFSNIVINRQNSRAKELMFDSDFNSIEMNIGDFDQSIVDSIHKPREYDKILKTINVLCSKFPFCRADFIQTKDKTYFCEFTFVKSGGINYYKHYELNEVFGNLFKL